MPRRYLSPSVGRDKLLAAIEQRSEFAALVYLKAIPQAGDDCTLPHSDPEELLYAICPARRDKTADDLATALELLTTVADEDGHTLLERLPDGRIRFPPASFYRYQSSIRAANRAPPLPVQVGTVDIKISSVDSVARVRQPRRARGTSSSSSSSFTTPPPPPPPTSTSSPLRATGSSRRARVSRPVDEAPRAAAAAEKALDDGACTPPPALRAFDRAFRAQPGYAPTAQFYAIVAERYAPRLDLAAEAVRALDYCRQKHSGRCEIGTLLNCLALSLRVTETRAAGGAPGAPGAPGAAGRPPNAANSPALAAAGSAGAASALPPPVWAPPEALTAEQEAASAAARDREALRIRDLLRTRQAGSRPPQTQGSRQNGRVNDAAPPESAAEDIVRAADLKAAALHQSEAYAARREHKAAHGSGPPRPVRPAHRARGPPPERRL